MDNMDRSKKTEKGKERSMTKRPPCRAVNLQPPGPRPPVAPFLVTFRPPPATSHLFPPSMALPIVHSYETITQALNPNPNPCQPWTISRATSGVEIYVPCRTAAIKDLAVLSTPRTPIVVPPISVRNREGNGGLRPSPHILCQPVPPAAKMEHIPLTSSKASTPRSFPILVT